MHDRSGNGYRRANASGRLREWQSRERELERIDDLERQARDQRLSREMEQNGDDAIPPGVM